MRHFAPPARLGPSPLNREIGGAPGVGKGTARRIWPGLAALARPTQPGLPDPPAVRAQTLHSSLPCSSRLSNRCARSLIAACQTLAHRRFQGFSGLRMHALAPSLSGGGTLRVLHSPTLCPWFATVILGMLCVHLLCFSTMFLLISKRLDGNRMAWRCLRWAICCRTGRGVCLAAGGRRRRPPRYRVHQPHHDAGRSPGPARWAPPSSTAPGPPCCAA